MSPKAQRVRLEEEEHSRWHRENAWSCHPWVLSQVRSLTCWVTVMDVGLGTVAA